MARELRQEILYDVAAGATTAENAAAEFRNDTSGMIHIRKIHICLFGNTFADGEQSAHELSKAPTFQSTTNNSPFWSLVARLSCPGGASITAGSSQMHKTVSYGRGQLTLEPNESLFLNWSKSSDPVVTYTALIEYEFG